MQLRVGLAKIGITVSLLAGPSASVLGSDDYNCTQLMYDHGLATSAQLHCGYDNYNKAIIEDAGKCMALANEYGKGKLGQLEDALKEGLADFQMEYEAASNKASVCSEFADAFSFIVRP